MNNPNIQIINKTPSFYVTIPATTKVITADIIESVINDAGYCCYTCGNKRHNKIRAIKALRENFPGLGLKDAKDIIEYVLTNTYNEEPYSEYVRKEMKKEYLTG